MRKSFVIFIIFFMQNVFCQAGGSQEKEILQTAPVKYVPIDVFNTNNRINIVNIDDYIEFVNDKKIEIIFTSDDTFVCEFNSILYTIPTNGYKTLNDFSTGKNAEFEDGASFYLALEQNLSSQDEVTIYRQDLERANALGFISLVDYRDALSTGFLDIENRNNFTTISGILRKDDLQKSVYYLNILLGLSDVDSNDVINNPSDFVNKGIKLYNQNYYNIGLTFNDRDRYGNYSNNNRDSRFYYACKLAQYNTADELLADHNIRNINSYTSISLKIKTTEAIYKELQYETYSDFSAALNGEFTNAADYYFAEKYNIRTNSVLLTNRTFLNEMEKIKQDYQIENNDYALLVHYVLKRQKAVPVSIEVFTREYNAEYNRNNWRTLNMNLVSFDTVYNAVSTFRNIVMYDQTGRSFYLK